MARGRGGRDEARNGGGPGPPKECIFPLSFVKFLPVVQGNLSRRLHHDGMVARGFLQVTLDAGGDRIWKSV